MKSVRPVHRSLKREGALHVDAHMVGGEATARWVLKEYRKRKVIPCADQLQLNGAQSDDLQHHDMPLASSTALDAVSQQVQALRAQRQTGMHQAQIELGLF